MDLESAWVRDVVRVHAGEVSTSCHAAGDFECGDDADRRGRNDADTIVLCRPTLELSTRIVTRAVIDGDDLEVVERLRDHGCHRFEKMLATVAYGHQNTYGGGKRSHVRRSISTSS